MCQYRMMHRTSLQHLANIPSVPLVELYKQMVTSNGPVHPFLSTGESTGETVSVWTLFSHAGVSIMAIGFLIPVRLGILFCYFFWCQHGANTHLQMQWQGWTAYSKTFTRIMTCVLNENLNRQRVNRSNGFH